MGLEISVIIPVSSDIRVERSVKSIDEDVEVVLALNSPTDEIKKMAESLGVKYCQIKDRSISKALNEGIKISKFDRVLLMDSDCVFGKGCIKMLYEGLNNADICKGKVVFTYESFISHLIAKAREFHTSDRVNAYFPPLAFKKGIKNAIGNKYFEEAMPFGEDYEFDLRIKKAGILIKYIPEAKVYHSSLDLISDLRSSFRYGVGGRLAIEHGILRGKLSVLQNIKDDILNMFSNHSKEYFQAIYLSKGLTTGIYMMLWNMACKFGYYSYALRIKPILRKIL